MYEEYAAREVRRWEKDGLIISDTAAQILISLWESLSDLPKTYTLEDVKKLRTDMISVRRQLTELSTKGIPVIVELDALDAWAQREIRIIIAQFMVNVLREMDTSTVYKLEIQAKGTPYEFQSQAFRAVLEQLCGDSAEDMYWSLADGFTSVKEALRNL